MTTWQEGQRVDLVQGGEAIREATVVRVKRNGDVVLDSGNAFRADGVARSPDMRKHGYAIRTRTEQP